MAGAYDLFTAVPEPKISLSLFGDAATQGIAAGNALPTETTAAIRGAMQGFETGQRMQSNQLTIERQGQENEIRANQIEQLPVQNEMDQVQLQNAQKVNEINQIKLEMDQANKQDNLDAELARAQYQKQSYDQKKTLNEKASSLQSKYAQADPLAQKQMLFSGEYDDVYAAEPKLYDQHLSKVYGSLNDSEKQAALLASGKLNINSRHEANLEKYTRELSKAKEQLDGDFDLKRAANAVNKNPEDVVDEIEPVGAGQYETKDDGTIIFGNDGRLKQKKGYVEGADSKVNLRIGPKIVARNVDKKVLDKITGFKSARNNVDGTIRDQQISDLEESIKAEKSLGAPQAAQQPQAARQPASSQETVGPPAPYRVKHNAAAIFDVPNISFTETKGVASNPKSYEITKNYLGLNDKDFLAIKPQVKDLLNIIDMGPKGWFGRYDKDQLQMKDDAETKIAEFVSEKEWDTNPEVREAYTDDVVIEHNRAATEWREAMTNPNTYAGGKIPSSAELDTPLTYETIAPVVTPKELYVLKNSGVVRDHLSKLADRLDEELKKNKQAEARLNTGVRDALTVKDLGRPNAAG